MSTLPDACVPCKTLKGAAPLSDVAVWHRQVPDWIVDGKMKEIQRVFDFMDAADLLRFLHEVLPLMNKHDHHAVVEINGGKEACFTLSTYNPNVRGLSINDFIMAKLIDRTWESYRATYRMDRKPLSGEQTRGTRFLLMPVIHALIPPSLVPMKLPPTRK